MNNLDNNSIRQSMAQRQSLTHRTNDVSFIISEGSLIKNLPPSPRPKQFSSLLESVAFSGNHCRSRMSAPEGNLADILIDCSRRNLPELCLQSLKSSYKGFRAVQIDRTTSPLHIAAEKGHIQVCEILMDYGKIQGIDVLDEQARTPLHLACQMNRPGVVRLLVRSGASLNLQDFTGQTPLHYAALTGNDELYQYLRDRSADASLVNGEGKTAEELIQQRPAINNTLKKTVPRPTKPPIKIVEDLDDSLDWDSADFSFLNFWVLRPIAKLSNRVMVYLTQYRPDGRLYSLKAIRKDKYFGLIAQMATAEKRILQKCQHKFIEKFFCAFQSYSYLYLVTEFYEGGSLSAQLSSLGRFEGSRAVCYMAECVVAIQELHRRGIHYGNLKPENLYLDGAGHLRLTHFEKAREMNQLRQVKSPLDTEKISNQADSESSWLETDWYMAGMLLNLMMVGYTSSEESVDEDAKDLISRLMAENPVHRLGVGGALEVKQHIFFRNIDWTAVSKREMKMPDFVKPEHSACAYCYRLVSSRSQLRASEGGVVCGWDVDPQVQIKGFVQ